MNFKSKDKKINIHLCLKFFSLKRFNTFRYYKGHVVRGGQCWLKTKSNKKIINRGTKITVIKLPVVKI